MIGIDDSNPPMRPLKGFDHDRKFLYVVYKIIFPNGKMYVGKDIGSGGHSIRYFGTWSRKLVEADFTKAELQSFVITREILFESDDKIEVGRKEMELIVELGANDPAKGYNRVPRFRG